MGRRTIAGHKITLHKRGDRSEDASPADLDGRRLSDIFEQWANTLKDKGVVNAAGQSFLRVTRVERYNDFIVLVDTMSGKAGEEGVVYDSGTSAVKYNLLAEDVPTSGSRAILLCPPRGQTALWFSEYSARSSGASLLLGLFCKSWRSFDTGYTMDRARLIAAEIALDGGVVTELEVRFTRRSNDRADAPETLGGVISHKFKPARKTPLPGRIINTFRSNPGKAYDLVEIAGPPEDADETEIFVSVDVEGKRRKVQILNPDDGVYFREELNDAGQPVLSDDEIVAYCTDEATTLLERSGGEWLPAWSRRGR